MFPNIYKKLKGKFCKRYPRFYGCMHKRKVVIKFWLALVISGLVDMAFLVLFYRFLELDILASASFAFTFAFFISFYLQKLWVFRNDGDDRIKKQMVLFLIMGLLKMILNAFGMVFLVEHVGVWYIFSQILVSFWLNLGTYFFEKYVIFKKENIL